MSVRIVLVGTSHPGNIGAVARAMKNMGIHDLALVNPRHFPHEDATVRASGATDILDAALIVTSLNEADRKRFAETLQARGYAPKRTEKARGFQGIRLLRQDYTDDPRYGG